VIKRKLHNWNYTPQGCGSAEAPIQGFSRIALSFIVRITLADAGNMTKPWSDGIQRNRVLIIKAKCKQARNLLKRAVHIRESDIERWWLIPYPCSFSAAWIGRIWNDGRYKKVFIFLYVYKYIWIKREGSTSR